MKTRIFILILLIIIFFSYKEKHSNANDIRNKSCVVINEKAKLTQTEEEKSKIIKRLNFLEQVSIIDSTENMKRININTQDGLHGWIDVNDISFVSYKWYKFVDVPDVAIFLPREKKEYGFIKNDRKKKIQEYKIYDKYHFIFIYKCIGSIDQFLKNYKKEMMQTGGDPNVIKFNYHDREVYYHSSKLIMNGTKYHMLLFETSKNNYLEVMVDINNRNPSISEDIIAKKILFSVLK